eukprot:gnl/TRDRNA2_/TRDRNA2_166860_c0_seq1.p1 gnl/TRDRNA2_/TRDRNA2_166860_c0~~gnl/TRDRNA2_/TRDRNA2_166860_c0_seq1.p1  ORF type:complete len:705 (-),score=104.28 gnl/TRDRNA2_/TRDRNA2_166860_c0_seq1:334-2448(-)
MADNCPWRNFRCPQCRAVYHAGEPALRPLVYPCQRSHEACFKCCSPLFLGGNCPQCEARQVLYKIPLGAMFSENEKLLALMEACHSFAFFGSTLGPLGEKEALKQSHNLLYDLRNCMNEHVKIAGDLPTLHLTAPHEMGIWKHDVNLISLARELQDNLFPHTAISMRKHLCLLGDSWPLATALGNLAIADPAKALPKQLKPLNDPDASPIDESEAADVEVEFARLFRALGELKQEKEFQSLHPLACDDEAMKLLSDLVRVHEYHPLRTTILGNEEHREQGEPGTLRKRAMKGDIEDLNKAVDIYLLLRLCMKKRNSFTLVSDWVMSQPGDWPTIEEEKLLESMQAGRRAASSNQVKATATDQTVGRAVSRLMSFRKGSAAAVSSPRRLLNVGGVRQTTAIGSVPPQPKAFLTLMIANLWDQLDFDRSGNLDMEEVREIFRLLLSRPLTAMVAREEVCENLGKANTWSRVDVLLACSSAALLLARDAKGQASKLWSLLDEDSNGAISEFEFRSLWDSACSKGVMEPLAQMAQHLLESQRESEKKMHEPEARRLPATESKPSSEPEMLRSARRLTATMTHDFAEGLHLPEAHQASSGEDLQARPCEQDRGDSRPSLLVSPSYLLQASNWFPQTPTATSMEVKAKEDVDSAKQRDDEAWSGSSLFMALCVGVRRHCASTPKLCNGRCVDGDRDRPVMESSRSPKDGE